MSTYGYYEGEYGDGKRLKTSAADWIFAAGYLLVAAAFFASVVWHWPVEVQNAASIFLTGALPIWILRAFVGVSWKKMAIGVIVLPVVAAVVLLASFDIGLILAGWLMILVLLALLFRRQIRRNFPRLLYALALRDEG